MELIEKILSEENLQKAIRKVKKNKGAPGVDKMTVQEVEQWFNQYKEDLISKILNKQYKPMPVKRVYIPKPNGKQRPLGIPTVVEAATIAADSLDLFIQKVQEEAKSNEFLNQLQEEDKYEMIKEVLAPNDYNFIVTPKEIDELIENMKDVVARGINFATQK